MAMSTELFSFFNSLSKIKGTDSFLMDFLGRPGDITRFAELKKHRETLAKLRELCLKYKVWFEDVRGPAAAGIDVTYDCNLKCPYCFVKELGRFRGSISKNKIFSILDELAKMGVMVVCLCGGEPTLRKDLIDIIRYGRDKGLHINMVTNGTLIDNNYARNLADAGICTVQVSLDGSRAEIHDTLRGLGTFEKVVNAIRNLREYGIHTDISFAATKLNINDFPNTVNLADRLDVKSVRTMFFVPECKEQLELFPSDEEYKKLISWIEENRWEYPLKLEFGDPTEHIAIGPYMSLLVIQISAEGYIMPTPYVNLAFGNIQLYSLHELWRNRLQYIFREDKVFRTISSLLKTEKDFMRITLLLNDLTSKGILTGDNGYVDVLRLDEEKKDLLSNQLKLALGEGGKIEKLREN